MPDSATISSADIAQPIAALPADRLYRSADLSGLSFATHGGARADRRAGRPAARARCHQSRHPDRQAGLQSVRDRPQRRAHAGGGQGRARRRRRARARPVRLGLCQQFRRCRQADRDRAAGRAARGGSRRHARADRRSEDGAARRCSRARTIRRAAAPSTRRSRRSRRRRSPALRDKAAESNIVIVRTPFGFALAPAENGEVVPPEQFSTWPEARRNADPGGHPGAGEGARARRAPDPAMGEGSGATRSASSTGRPPSSAVDQLIEETKARVHRSAADHRAHRDGAGRSGRQRRHVRHEGRSERRPSRPTSSPELRSTATRSMCWSRRTVTRRARRSSRSCIPRSAT